MEESRARDRQAVTLDPPLHLKSSANHPDQPSPREYLGTSENCIMSSEQFWDLRSFSKPDCIPRNAFTIQTDQGQGHRPARNVIFLQHRKIWMMSIVVVDYRCRSGIAACLPVELWLAVTSLQWCPKVAGCRLQLSCFKENNCGT